MVLKHELWEQPKRWGPTLSEPNSFLLWVQVENDRQEAGVGCIECILPLHRLTSKRLRASLLFFSENEKKLNFLKLFQST